MNLGGVNGLCMKLGLRPTAVVLPSSIVFRLKQLKHAQDHSPTLEVAGSSCAAHTVTTPSCRYCGSSSLLLSATQIKPQHCCCAAHAHSTLLGSQEVPVRGGPDRLGRVIPWQQLRCLVEQAWQDVLP